MIKKIQQQAMQIQKKPLTLFFLGLILLVLILFFARYLGTRRLIRETNDMAIYHANVVLAQATQPTEHIILPGSVLAWHEAAVFARAKGYLKQWYVDIGYTVQKGDVLAVIERPELDAEFLEAKDYLNVILAESELAQITAKRWGRLVKTDSVSKQANDNKNYAAQAYDARVSQARANVEKLRAYVSFETVVAPFNGIISLRQTDIGDLINIGSNPSEAQPLFRIVQTDPLRLYVNIPQNYTSRITRNMHIDLRFDEYPGKVFSATLLKYSGGIDPITLTLQAEFEVQNKDNILIPGGYTQVDFTLPSYSKSIILPVNTLIFRSDGLQVAVVGKDSHISIRNIQIGTDFGNTIQINSGIQVGEQVVLNPSDIVHDGQQVHVVDPTLRKIS